MVGRRNARQGLRPDTKKAWPVRGPCLSLKDILCGLEARSLPIFTWIGPSGISAPGQTLHQLRPAKTESVVRRFDMDDMAQIAQPLQQLRLHRRFASHL